jgi:hypothetical protein
MTEFPACPIPYLSTFPETERTKGGQMIAIRDGSLNGRAVAVRASRRRQAVFGGPLNLSRVYGAAVAAGQSHGPDQPAGRGGEGAADRPASDSTFDRVESARRGLRRAGKADERGNPLCQAVSQRSNGFENVDVTFTKPVPSGEHQHNSAEQADSAAELERP